MKTQVTIIGAGNMGLAMAKALIQDGQWAVTLVDRPDKKITSISRAKLTTNMSSALRSAKLVVLAVKPQDGKQALRNLKGTLPSSALLISIMMGANMKGLQRESGHSNVVRVMPNTPAQIGAGMTVWYSNPNLSSTHKKLAQKFFETFGEALEVKQERLVDVATAISGSGPAYVFALAEYMTTAGIQLGLSQTQAQHLAVQTLSGASQLLKQTGEDPKLLRQKVTSRKGTTEAAFKVFENRHTKQIYLAALKAAFARAKKVSKAW